MKAAHLVSVFVGLGLAVACGIEVGVDNKACPCGDGYECVQNICVKPGTVLPTTTIPQPVCDPCTCKVDADCLDPTRPVCSEAGMCVECKSKADKCAAGSYCNAKNQCTLGCKASADCEQLSPTSRLCATDRHQCVSCLTAATCGTGQACSPSGSCVNSCSDSKPCSGGQACCGGLCVDVTSDVLNCGKCDAACAADNGTPRCAAGICNTTCANGYAHCVGDIATCETTTRTDVEHCGTCDHSCTATVQHVTGLVCAASACAFTGCEPGFEDKDGNKDNGCESMSNSGGSTTSSTGGPPPCGTKNVSCCSGNVCTDGSSCKSGTCRGG